MFLRQKIRNKDGKRHRYWSLVENSASRAGRYLLRSNLTATRTNGRSRPTSSSHLHVTIGRRLKAPAPGLTRRSLIEKFAAVQTIDVRNPTPAAANCC
jgi:hypothetical protein